MAGLRTVALIERKPEINRDLFSRYWRDVHGVMAARIPGFSRYTQYHVTPQKGRSQGQNFEGIALVAFATEEDRGGLGNSAVTRHIHRDEQNIFRRALLYNLAEGAFVGSEDEVRRNGLTEFFYVLPSGCDPEQLCETLENAGCAYCDVYDLRSGDPAAWNETDVNDGGEGNTFVALLHGGWPDALAADAPEPEIDDRIGIYRVDEIHIMVENGFPTAVGLRGLDAARTIMEAGADNQLAYEVVEDIYGLGLAPADRQP
jgi:hypothetical protein